MARIVLRHRRQVLSRTKAEWRSMARYWALTWRPGDNTGTFLGKQFRPLGRATAVSLFQNRGSYSVVGVGAEIDPETAQVLIGGEARNRFAHDLRKEGGSGAINPEKNPTLALTALEMDALLARAAENSYAVPKTPTLPGVYLGFPKGCRPQYEDTPALRARVAAHMQRPKGYVDAMEPAQRDLLLRAEWESCWLPAGHEQNCTGMDLISLQFCTRVKAAVVFEDFRDLIGVEIFNPARRLLQPNHVAKNPTRRVLRALKISHEELIAPDTEVDSAFIMKVEEAIKKALGSDAALCRPEDLWEAILHPEQPVTLSGVENLANVDEEQLISLMRVAAGKYGECCTDAALLAAAKSPHERLWAAGLAKVQVLQHAGGPLRFGPHDLKLDRVVADFSTVRPWWQRKEGKRVKSRA